MSLSTDVYRNSKFSQASETTGNYLVYSSLKVSPTSWSFLPTYGYLNKSVLDSRDLCADFGTFFSAKLLTLWNSALQTPASFVFPKSYFCLLN